MNEELRVNLLIPFDPSDSLSYIDKDISVLWNFSKKEGTTEFMFEEGVDNLLKFNKKNQSRSVKVSPKNTGTYFLNQLVYFEMKDSIFEFKSDEIIVK